MDSINQLQFFMILTDEGERLIKAYPKTKRETGLKLVNGAKDILTYTEGANCFATVAFVRYLLRADDGDRGAITTSNLKNFDDQGWTQLFFFQHGARWDGFPVFKGKAMAFYRHSANKFAHAVIALENNMFRGVNSFVFGNHSWNFTPNLSILGARNPDGSYNFDGDRISVFVSDL